MQEERIQRLLRRIEVAFDGVPRPRITKSVARGYDDEWNLSDDRIRELQALDPEQRWQDVDHDAVRFFQEYFTFSDAEGWRFYLPAHMTHYLRGFPDYGWDAVYWSLCAREPKLDLLSEDQRDCVREFLEIIHEAEKAKEA